MSYFNTNNIEGEALNQAHKDNESQEDRVYKIFQEQQKPMAYFEVHDLFGRLAAPEQSIKRALTNLLNEGKLTKTGIKTQGIWGRPCYKYQLRNDRTENS